MFVPNPPELVRELMDLSEFFTIQPIQYADQSQLILLKGTVEYTGDTAASTNNNFGRSSQNSGDKRFLPQYEHHVLGSNMFNSLGNMSSSNGVGHYHYTMTSVRLVSNSSQLFNVSGLPPMILPTVFERVDIFGRQETKRNNVHFNAHYYELHLSDEQEKALESPETGWITYHQLKMIARRVFCFRSPSQPITFYTKLLMGQIFPERKNLPHCFFQKQV